MDTVSGFPMLLLKAVVKSDSQESDAMTEMVTGEKPQGATCNAQTADGQRCRRAAAPGQTRCAHHTGAAVKGDDVSVNGLLRKAERLFEQLPKDAAERYAVGQAATVIKLRANATQTLLSDGSVTKASGIPAEQLQELANAVRSAEEFVKGQVQDGLHGTATPERGGTIASGASRLAGPATVGSVPGSSPGSNGLPGVRAPLLAGQSTSGIPAEGRLNGGAVPQGPGEGLDAIVRAMTAQPQTLPGKPANPQLVKALEEVVEAQRAAKAVQDRPGFVDHALHSLAVARAEEDATLAALKAHATAQFGGGQFGGRR